MIKREHYDRDWIANYYNEYGEKEWYRLIGAPPDRVSLAIHTHYLKKFINKGSRVLEIGAGPGRFTRVLSKMGCTVVVGDISEVQLESHKKHSVEGRFDGCVEDRLLIDVCDLSRLKPNSFDAVVCYGGPLSYVFEKVDTAIAECVRVCSAKGHVLFSVMSLWGSVHRALGKILPIPAESNRKIVKTGDLVPENWEGIQHRCHIFRSQEMLELVTAAGLRPVAVSASNYLSINWDTFLSELDDTSEQWQHLIELEIEATQESGCLDAGTHIIVVGEV